MSNPNIPFLNQLLAAQLNNVKYLRGIVDRKEAEKQEVQDELDKAQVLIANKDAEISNLQAQLAQSQSGFDAETQAQYDLLEQNVEALHDAISDLVMPAIEIATAPDVVAAEPAVELDEADADFANFEVAAEL